MKTLRYTVTGVVAGTLGTAAMDLVWYRRFRAEGGKDSFWRWETAKGVMGWDEASAPGQLGQKVLRRVTGSRPPDDWARTTTNVVHWSTGMAWGAQYGLLASRNPRHRWLQAVALGPAAWSSAYVLLPLAKVYKPIWEYDAQALTKDFTAHLVFGSASAATFGMIVRKVAR